MHPESKKTDPGTTSWTIKTSDLWDWDGREWRIVGHSEVILESTAAVNWQAGAARLALNRRGTFPAPQEAQ
jgi:hypothetical protein